MEQEGIINQGMIKIDKLNEELEEKNNLNEKLKKKNEKNLKLIDEKEKEIMVLKSKVEKNGQKVDMNEVMVINFISQVPEVQLGIKCLPSDYFVDVEKKLYEVYENLRERDNYFLSQGIYIYRFKRISENNILNNAKIMIYKKESI